MVLEAAAFWAAANAIFPGHFAYFAGAASVGAFASEDLGSISEKATEARGSCSGVSLSLEAKASPRVDVGDPPSGRYSRYAFR